MLIDIVCPMTACPFDIKAIRRDFPSLCQAITSPSLVYLDSAATTQKPQCVIDEITQYYKAPHGAVHRSSHFASASSTHSFEAARQTVADFIHAPKEGIVWTRGTTEGINLIAQSYAGSTLKRGDEILISEMEHHANIVPWQIVAKQTGAKIVKWPMDIKHCQLDMAAFDKLLTSRTKIVAVAHMSNVTATCHPLKYIIDKAHQMNAIVVVDGAQGIVHQSVNIKQLNADFYVFSGHKLFGPEGIGVLYGKPELLQAMPPWHGGGKIIEKVSFSGTSFINFAAKFEAGTPNVAGALALATAINWYQSIDSKAAENHIASLQHQLIKGVQNIDGIKLIGVQKKTSVLAFAFNDIHYSDIAMLLDKQGIALRSGQLCAHPFMDALNIKGCLRASIALYNNSDDIDKCIIAIHKATELL